MTTKVVISCPDDSHNSVKVLVEDRNYDPHEGYTDKWNLTREIDLAPKSATEVYVYDSRRITVVEVPA